MNAFSVLNPPKSQPTALETWPQLSGLGLALAIQSYAKRAGGPVLVAVPDGYTARYLRDDLSALGEVNVELFPDWEVLPYDLYSPHPDLISRRLDVLKRLPEMTTGVVLAPLTSLIHRLPPTTWLAATGLALRVGESIALGGFRQRLLNAGYLSSDQVWQPGQFAQRGSVLDLWPMGSANKPYRIELFDEDIDSIRIFDPDSQRSIEKIDHFALMPAREYPFDEAGRNRFKKNFRLRFDVDLRQAVPYQDVAQAVQSPGLEQYLPLFFDHTDTLLDYLPQPSRVVVLGGLDKAAYEYSQQIHQRFDQRAHDIERPVLRPDELFLSADELLTQLRERAVITVSQTPTQDPVAPSAPVIDLAKPEQAIETLNTLPGRVLIAADTPSRRELITRALYSVRAEFESVDSWVAFRSGTARLNVTTMALTGGVALPHDGIVVLSEAECFPDHTRTRRANKRSGQDPEALIKSLMDLQAGALIVHLDHGIGRYRGLEVLETSDHVGEFLTLEYADGDVLYVPVTDLDLVSRYTGQDPDSVTLHRLGSEQWKKAKQKAAKQARDVAAELLNLQARRAARTNLPIEVDEGLYARFAAGFEYDETEDQLQAIEATLHDLGSDQPMDRVVCGDVGFGKTEVALRAAFVVAQTGAQVAILAPTTLLAEQHHRQFADRFADWPVNVALLSRTGASTQKTLDGLKDGTVDIVIGTHRLLQSDVAFKNLHLVVIDEEQRFGVKQKERLKALRAEVNLLTLTATPIPRTLNMTMAGLRELSIIATPPQARLAVKTFVHEWDTDTIKDAVAREFQRGGQVYYLHNEVKTMEKTMRDLEALFPQATIGMAHGQMPAALMERTMRDFYARKINLLVCSTIIENGIDVPTANTIIINRADKFGLAQLHQLRGRVGRSHHLAFAYLITPHWKSLTKDARKRLEAIASMEDLGAGFSLASHDLEIRGAGQLLGEDQSGQIEAIGFSLYSDLLNRAVSALKSGQEPDLEQPLATSSDIDLHTEARIPEAYLPDIHQRLVLYKRITQANDEAALYDLEVEMIDRFGLLPEPIKALFTAARLRLAARPMGIERLEIGPHGGRVEFVDKPNIKIDEFLRMIQHEAHTYELPAPNRLRIKGTFEDYSERVALADDLLSRLGLGQEAAA